MEDSDPLEEDPKAADGGDELRQDGFGLVVVAVLLAVLVVLEGMFFIKVLLNKDISRKSSPVLFDLNVEDVDDVDGAAVVVVALLPELSICESLRLCDCFC